MKLIRTFDTQLQTNLLILFTAGLLFWSSMASLLPTLPIYIESLGGNKQEVGLVMACFAVGLLLSRPWLGRLADMRGRKIVLIIGIAVAVLAPLSYLVATSIPLLMVMRVFHGISIAAFSIAFIAMVADISPANQRGEIMSYMNLVNPIGMALGPAIGGYIQALGGDKLLFLLSSEVALIALLGALQVKNTSAPKSKKSNTQNHNFWQILISERVRVPSILMLLVGLALGALHTFVPLYIKSANIDLNPGLFYTAAAIASFSVRLFTGRASDRLGRGLFVTIGLVLYSLAMLLLWQAKSEVAFLVAAVFEGMGGGIFIPTIATMLTDRAQPQERGRVFAISLSGFDVGIGVGGAILGYLAQNYGYPFLFAVTTGLTFLAVIIFVTLGNKDLGNSFKFAIGRAPDKYALSNNN
ncbi:MFS transporter [Calothrix sp. 336/3]|uniref:MFS transporter n=1 Tax=Calothrix sp. 336/3 TaxID=1337936 RepID=UPI0004E29324|nr:MFS transporter [Calothrix sp. 336/3]AKG23517.1 MFS transporter [Calothrix sp. 336/3]